MLTLQAIGCLNAFRGCYNYSAANAKAAQPRPIHGALVIMGATPVLLLDPTPVPVIEDCVVIEELLVLTVDDSEPVADEEWEFSVLVGKDEEDPNVAVGAAELCILVEKEDDGAEEVVDTATFVGLATAPATTVTPI